MTMNSTEYNLRLRWSDRLGIEFLGPVEPDRWPQTHRRLFADVQKLGRRTYDNFVDSISIDSIEKPWRNSTRSRADRLSQLAFNACKERRNESSWRFAVENEIMHRFSVEVACPKCRNKLWESEIPAATDGIHVRAEFLEVRRNKRKPCRCPLVWGQSQYDSGINMLFSDRAEQQIRHDPPLPVLSQPEKRKSSEAPDRIYGLKQTDNFKLLLDSDDKRGAGATPSRSLCESMEVSPFEPEGEPLLYPFLIMEAKSSKGADRREVNMQTAFVIRRLLNVQLGLKLATGEETQWESGPLVWFLAWRGEIWEVSAAFVHGSGVDPIKYTRKTEILKPVVDLWSGNICDKNGALQLLLIIDYIFDWARDIYRPAILDELNTLSTGDVTAADTNVFSTISPIRRTFNWLNHSQDTSSSTFQASSSNDHLNLDFLNIICAEGVVQDASIIESRYLALHLVESDIDDFLLSFESAEEAQKWLQGTLKCLPSFWRVSAETLGTLENTWTTEGRLPREAYQHGEIFYIQIAINMFVSHIWEPTRQLTCLCISEGALRKLLGPLRDLELHRNPIVSASAIEVLLNRILNQSILDNLTAAVSMLCISSCFYKRHGIVPEQLLVTKSNGLYSGFRADKSPSLLKLVSSVYQTHKIGQREPRDPYIAFSHLQSKQIIVYRGDEIQMWPKLPPLVREKQWKCVLVDGVLKRKGLPQHGLYVFDRSSEYEELPELPELPSIMWRHGLYFKTVPVCVNMWDEEHFKYFNNSIKLEGEWSSKAELQPFIQWAQSLRMQLKLEQRGTRPGDSALLPMTICEE